jgi:hypothetical protein
MKERLQMAPLTREDQLKWSLLAVADDNLLDALREVSFAQGEVDADMMRTLLVNWWAGHEAWERAYPGVWHAGRAFQGLASVELEEMFA